MTSKFIALSALSLTVLAVSACTTTPTSTIANTPPGTYKSTTKTTNSEGTNTSVEKTTKVGYDANGNKVGTVKTETTTDPKGLMNKSKSTSTTTVK